MSSPWPGHAPAPPAPPYGAAQPYGTPPPPGRYPPHGQAYGYQPYGPAPAGMGGVGFVRAPRPGTMVLALVLQIVCVLLSAFSGGVLLVGGSRQAARSDVLDGTGLFLQIVGGVYALAALLYLVFAVLAFRGGRGGRVLVVVLSVIYLLPTAIGNARLTWALAVLGVIGAALLFTPAARRFFANPRLR